MRLLIILVTLTSLPAQGEEHDIMAGATFGVVFPGLDPQKPTRPALAAWSVGGFVKHGLVDDFFLGLSMRFSSFSGSIKDYVVTDKYNQDLHGNLSFDCHLFHPSLFVQYQFYAGLGLLPHIDLGAGYLWTISSNHQYSLVDLDSPPSLSADMGYGSPVISLTVGLDWRFINLFQVGLAAEYHYIPIGTLRHMWGLPLTLALFW